MGKALCGVGRQADAVEEITDLLAAVGGGTHTRDDQGLGDEIAHAHARVEARIGILKNHLYAAAEAAEPAIGHGADVLAIKDNAA